MKNTALKERKVNAPYEVWTNGTWVWQVLKKWQADDNKPYGRWLCAVQSECTLPSYDLGDVYVAEIKSNARLVWSEKNGELPKEYHF